MAVTFKGRAATPITPGRAGTANQNLLTFWNGSAAKICRIGLVGVDLYQTVIKAITVPPPIIRFYRVTAAPTSGATSRWCPAGAVPISPATRCRR